MKLPKSILYINFAPYDNAGMIRDYLIDRYYYVFHFSFNFHYLQGSENSSSLTVYKKGKKTSKSLIFQILPHPKLTFVMLPIRSVVFLIEIIIYTYVLKKKYGEVDDYFTVNAFTAWCGLILKKLRLVKRTIFWVWDYYPPKHKSRTITLMRWAYWQFDKLATHSDKLIFLNHKLEDLRKKIRIIPFGRNYPIIGIGTNVLKCRHQHKNVSLLFIGVLKRSQGLDLLIDNSHVIKKHFRDIEVHIVGSGPDENYYKTKALGAAIPFIFHGLMDLYSKKAMEIIKNTNIGIAPYKPEPGNVSYYGDPSKIKNYLSFGLPVITTNVFEFSEIIRTSGAGEIIPYKLEPFLNSIQKIISNYGQYSVLARSLAQKYYYAKYYDKMFA